MPDRIVSRVSRKTRWWMATGFVLTVALTLIFLVGLTIDQSREVDRLKAERIADAQSRRTAENTNAVTVCLSGVYQIPDFLSALDGLDAVMQNQIEAARAAIEAEPNGPLAAARRATLRRALRARAGLARLISGEDGQGGIVRQRKTLKECQMLAAELGVDFDRLAKIARER